MIQSLPSPVMTHQQIAAELGLSVAKVKDLEQRALAKLRVMAEAMGLEVDTDDVGLSGRSSLAGSSKSHIKPMR